MDLSASSLQTQPNQQVPPYQLHISTIYSSIARSIASILSHTTAIHDIQISSDGNYLFAIGQQNTLKVSTERKERKEGSFSSDDIMVELGVGCQEI